MAKSLVIVESPAKGKTIAGYLGADDYTVMASVGHIRDLPSDKKELQAESPEKVETHGRLAGIDPNDHFDVVYVVHPSKKKVVTELKRALKGADELILATDEDREGEAIGWHVLKVLDPKVPVKRMVFHEITPHAIREALEHPRDLDMKLVEAQEARRILDRLVGWETSPILWRVFGRGQAASAGRVQSVAVRMVVERERARMAFRSGQWHDLEGTFLAANADANAQPFGAALVDVNDRRVAEGRDFDAATGRLRGRPRCRPARCRRCDRARRPVARRSLPRRERRFRPVHRTAARAVHDVDAAAGSRPQVAVHVLADDGGRPAALRAGLHHVHADRQYEPVGAGDHRGAYRDPAAVRRRLSAPGRRGRIAARSRTRRKHTRRSGPRATRSAHPMQSGPSWTLIRNGSTS